MVSKSIYQFLFYTIIVFILAGCPPKGVVQSLDLPTIFQSKQPGQELVVSKQPEQAQVVSKQAGPDEVLRLRNTLSVGKKFTESAEFQKALSTIKLMTKQTARLYVARVDELSLGSNYKGMDAFDVAFENGIVAGLISQNVKVVEKLDAAKIRDKNEYMTNSPMQAFYMHPINLKSLEIIKRDLVTNYLLSYSVIQLSKTSDDILVYFRIIDLTTMQLVGSFALRNGNKDLDPMAKEYFEEYTKCFSSLKDAEIPNTFSSIANRLAVIDVDIINVKGDYQTAPSLKLMGIEDGVISGLMANLNYPTRLWVTEKTSGFKFKFAPVYNNIIFNTNPFIYEEWPEISENTSCTELLLYRYVKDEGIFLRVIDVRKQGEILYSNFVSFTDAKYKGCENIFKTVSTNASLSSELLVQNLQNKRVLIVDGDYHSIDPNKYSQERKNYKEHQFAIEEGISKGLLDLSGVTKLQLKDKLKTLYLKRDWMYSNKIFNANPLYLDTWKQLQTFGVDVLLVYNNLIRYHDLSDKTSTNFRNIAVSYKVIDVSTGDIIYVNEITQ